MLDYEIWYGTSWNGNNFKTFEVLILSITKQLEEKKDDR
jgi:hypothetical protein